MRLTYPKIKQKNLIKKIILELKKHKHSYRTFIRNYSTFLNKEKKKFLKSLNILIDSTNGFGEEGRFSKEIEKKLSEYFIKKIK